MFCLDGKKYVLQHSYEYGESYEHTETKFIGVYSSLEKAKKTINKLKNLEGFRNYPLECFYIDEYLLDEDNWREGFVSCEGT